MPMLAAGPCILDTDDRCLIVRNRRVPISRTEFNLLATLVIAAPRSVSALDLMTVANTPGFAANPRRHAMVYISRLRAKVPLPIHTRRQGWHKGAADYWIDLKTDTGLAA